MEEALNKLKTNKFNPITKSNNMHEIVNYLNKSSSNIVISSEPISRKPSQRLQLDIKHAPSTVKQAKSSRK